MKLPLLSLIAVALATAQTQPPNSYVVREVGHELGKLPYLSIFDDVSYRVEGDNVILTGEVTRPIVKTDAERLVKRVEGVAQVIDRIEVLPLSPNDERIRRATYFALVRQPQLETYFLQASCPIRIIVKNGDVTLQGAVSNQADADLAKLTAGNVSGVFHFTSKLEVENGR
ncbi:MAG TPA: BON domain-containing protein [Bryobacteraceae bacterium]|jgi:osmotically-inducible protein OsmY|nr:BON domain-containing protein [Bryobacteraceae bacterium]